MRTKPLVYSQSYISHNDEINVAEEDDGNTKVMVSVPFHFVPELSPVSIQTQSLALCALRLGGNRAKRKRLRWQAANHGCHCFDRASY